MKNRLTPIYYKVIKRFKDERGFTLKSFALFLCTETDIFAFDMSCEEIADINWTSASDNKTLVSNKARKVINKLNSLGTRIPMDISPMYETEEFCNNHLDNIVPIYEAGNFPGRIETLEIIPSESRFEIIYSNKTKMWMCVPLSGKLASIVNGDQKSITSKLTTYINRASKTSIVVKRKQFEVLVNGNDSLEDSSIPVAKGLFDTSSAVLSGLAEYIGKVFDEDNFEQRAKAIIAQDEELKKEKARRIKSETAVVEEKEARKKLDKKLAEAMKKIKKLEQKTWQK